MVKSKKGLGANSKPDVVKEIDKERVITALKRVKGQVSALIEKLEVRNYDPEQILIQLAAAAAALASVKTKFVEEYTKAKVIASLKELSKWL